jgi:PAS domain S-box-containing protein
MRILADFLAQERAPILELFTTRVQTIAPRALTTSQLADHVPQILHELERTLRASSDPADCIMATSPSAEAHGRQRLRLGYDLVAVVREYGVLRDCILEHLEVRAVMPSLRELRILSDGVSAATADSIQGDEATSERRHLLDLFDQAPGFVCFLRGRELVFDLANQAYHQIVGHRDLLGKRAREALPEVAGQGFFELLDEVFRSGEAFIGRAMKLQIQRAAGAPLADAYFDFVYQPIRGEDGSVVGILVQGHDITEAKLEQSRREAAELALRGSEERYRTLFDSIDDGYCLIEMLFDGHGVAVDYRFLDANPAFEAQSGLVEALGKTIREMVPDHDALWFERYGSVAVTGESARFQNHAIAMGRWFDVYASRVGPPELRQVAVVFKDITAQKRIEAEREELLALESAARKEAEEASRLRDEFLATVSHELRTPLAAILGWVQLLRSETLSPEKHDRALETVERNARAQAQLIEDLLDVSRILAGKLRLEVEPVEFHALVEAALETVRPAADAKDLGVQATLAPDATVMGDPHRLQQIIWNLLSNAVKFTPKGGRVQVVVECRNSTVKLTVSDTGQGIAPEFQPHIFERFRQADGTTTRSYGGLGLGLSIVRQLVDMHGGAVSVFSEGKGRGSTFTVQLPLAVARRREVVATRPAAPVTLPRGYPCPPELDGLHVLVVDDEQDTRDLVRTLLELCGARIRTAGSVADALRMFEAQRPDVLVSDIGMPEQDGYALIQQIRKLSPEAGGDISAIALTAYARTQDRTRALLAGFSNHVAKPVEPLELLAVVASLSGRGRNRTA